MIPRGNKKAIAQAVGEVWEACDAVVSAEEETAKAVKTHVANSQADLIAERKRLFEALDSLKQERIADQKKLVDLQRRLGYAMEQFEQDKTKLLECDNLMGIDIKGEENKMKDKVDDILGTLKDKLSLSARDIQAEASVSRVPSKPANVQRPSEVGSKGTAQAERKKKATGATKPGH